ncbi:MAG: fatty acid desaturase [Rudaea sp.]|nr:fatty acid desaturase [Rudaea sp.]
MPSIDESEILSSDIPRWRRTLGQYRTPSALRGSYELAVTVIPFALAWILMYWALTHGHMWLYALLLLPAAGLLVRLFLIQHDCGHRAFFASRKVNDWLGRLISVLTLTPYDHWRRAHSIHHATSGNLARRGVGDVDTLTVAEYLARPPWQRLRYRAYRHPSVMFGIGPFFLFVLQNRLPAGFMRSGWLPWASTMGTNVAIAAVAGLLIWAVGLPAFLLVQAPVLLVGAAAGVWLFYVQHQFERTYWAKREAWNVHEAGLRGSSHYDLPGVLKWFTANIGVHHVHHLASQIPYYRLPEVLRDHPELRGVGRLTLLQSFKCVRLVLWDEESRRLISFKQLRRSSGLKLVHGD